MNPPPALNESKGEIIMYEPNASQQRIEVKILNDTVWLSLNDMVELFERDKSVISRHIKNIFTEGELKIDWVVAKSATTASDGKTYEVDYYSLDVIISVGYRIKSKRGTDFRIWATLVLKDYMFKGIAIHKRIENLEHHALSTEKRLSKTEQQLDFFIEKALPRKEWIFYDGQVFDAYAFVADLVKSAKKRLILIDNYLDETVFTLLSQRCEGVTATIYTENISQALALAIKKHNEQYPTIEVNIYKKNHDRFLIVDDEIYHIWASIKDLGHKLFAFSKINIDTQELLRTFVSKH